MPDFATVPNFTRELGADIVMESMSLIDGLSHVLVRVQNMGKARRSDQRALL